MDDVKFIVLSLARRRMIMAGAMVRSSSSEAREGLVIHWMCIECRWVCFHPSHIRVGGLW